jgi:hypothetical protein
MANSQKSVTGGCQCGAVTYEAKGEPGMVIQCEPQVIIKGKTKGYSYTADSGGKATTNFCPECGSVIFGTTTSFPGLVAIRLGTMDDSSAFQPQMDVYMKRLRTWDHDLKGAPGFDAMPPMPARP